MRNMTKRTISAALILALILSLFVCSVSAASGKITTTPTGYTQASDVEYVKVGKTVANWGARNEDCVLKAYISACNSGICFSLAN